VEEQNLMPEAMRVLLYIVQTMNLFTQCQQFLSKHDNYNEKLFHVSFRTDNQKTRFYMNINFFPYGFSRIAFRKKNQKRLHFNDKVFNLYKLMAIFYKLESKLNNR